MAIKFIFDVKQLGNLIKLALMNKSKTHMNHFYRLKHLGIRISRYFLITTACLSFCAQLMAQKVVTGTITDNDDTSPIPGATIQVKGTLSGTVTDADGYFSLNVQSENDVLVIFFVGYLSEEVLVGNQTSISVSLTPDITELDEIVVVGYGTQKRKVVTAATTSVKGDELVKRNTTQALQALQGNAAGVNIRSSSGQPGEGLRVNIRGLGTIGNAGPLYMVDGVATGDISYLNNADIESIDVLKDAASAAIYGSRAANGVVLITTKKGSPGKQQITFDSFVGIQNRYKTVDMLNAREFAQIMNEQHLNSGGTVDGLPFDVNDLPAYADGEQRRHKMAR